MSLVKRRKGDGAKDKNQQLINVASEDTPSVLIDVAVGLEGHQGPVLSTKFSHDGSKIVSSGVDRTILLWNLPVDNHDESPNYGVLTGHKSAVTSVRWSYDDAMIVSCSADSTVGFWDATTGQRIRKCVSHELVVNEIAISPDSTVISVADDGNAYLWDQREKSPIGNVKTEYPLLTATFNKSGNSFYMAGIDPVVQCFDIRQVEKPLWTDRSQQDSITSLAVNNDDSILLARTMNDRIRTYNSKPFIPEGMKRINPSILRGSSSTVNETALVRACFGKDGIQIFSGSGMDIFNWDFTTSAVKRQFDGHRSEVLSVDQHPTESIIASSSNDGLVIVREIK